MTELVTLSKASKMLGVTTKTLRTWSNEEKIKSVRTDGGHRRIPIEEIKRLQNETSNDERTVTLVYARCSTQKQAENLERQVGRLLEHCAKQKWQVELFKDIGSGLNEKRKQFKKLLKRIGDKDVRRVVAEYKDRLTRFGFESLQVYCENLGVEVVILNQAETKEFEQELVEDIIGLVSSYSAKLYGRRGGRKKK